MMRESCRLRRIKTVECITLIALLVFLAFTSAGAQTFKVLNPEGLLPEIDLHALSPRIKDFSGKTLIIFDGRGGYAKPMKGLPAQLKAVLPADTKLVYYAPKSHSVSKGALSKIPAGDAAIVGHGY